MSLWREFIQKWATEHGYQDELHVSEAVEEFYREFGKELARPACRLPWAKGEAMLEGQLPTAQPETSREPSIMERLEIDMKAVHGLMEQVARHIGTLHRAVGLPEPEYSVNEGAQRFDGAFLRGPQPDRKFYRGASEGSPRPG